MLKFPVHISKLLFGFFTKVDRRFFGSFVFIVQFLQTIESNNEEILFERPTSIKSDREPHQFWPLVSIDLNISEHDLAPVLLHGANGITDNDTNLLIQQS